MVRSWRKKHSPERCSLAATRSAMLQSSPKRLRAACKVCLQTTPARPSPARKMRARNNLGVLAELVPSGVEKLQQNLSFALLCFGEVVCPALRRKRKRKELTSKVRPLWGKWLGCFVGAAKL